MSCLCASYYTEEARHSRNLDKAIYEESLRALRRVKILLLGAGETGKSTFAKQMRIIYGEDFDHNDLLEFRDVIYTNIFKAIQVLCDARRKLHIPWGDESFEEKAQQLLQWKIPHRVEQSLFIEKVGLLNKLWHDKGIQGAYSRKREYQLVSGKFKAVVCGHICTFLKLTVQDVHILVTSVDHQTQRMGLER